MIAPHVGGAFGGKAGIIADHAAVVAAARAAGPAGEVDRDPQRGDALDARPRPGAVRRARADRRRTGSPGLRVRIVGDCGAYAGFGGALARRPDVHDEPGPLRHPARSRYDAIAALTNTAPVGAFRGAGRPEAAAAARAADRPRRRRARARARGDPAPQPDPARRVPLHDPDRRRPTTSATTTCRCARRCGSPTSTTPAASSSAAASAGEVQLLGIGIATYVEITGFGGSEFGSVHDPRRRLGHRRWPAPPAHGQGHATSFSMIVADRLGIPMEDITYVQSDTAAGPHRRRHRRLALAAARRQRRRPGGRRGARARPSTSPPGCSRPTPPTSCSTTAASASPASPAPASPGRSSPPARTSTTAASASDTDFTQDGATFPFGAHVVDRRGRHRDRPGHAAAPRRRRRLRPGPQPADRRRPAARRRASRASPRRCGSSSSTTRTARR